MTPPTPTYIPDILEEHVEELAFLWGRRQGALQDPDCTFRHFLDLEARITAHRDGILAVGDQALPLLEETLTGDDPPLVFAAAYVLLHTSNASAAARAVDAFRSAEGERLAALEEALRHGPIGGALPAIQDLCRNGSTPVALAASTVLAFQGAAPDAPAIPRFLHETDPVTREHAWRLVAYLGAAIDAKQYAAAMREPAGPTRRAALHAGAWSRERGILAACRKLVADAPTKSPDALVLLAVLGSHEDLSQLRQLAEMPTLGPLRFRLLGAFGHPALIDTVLRGIEDPDPATATAAGAAFTKITGQNIDADRRATLPLEGGATPDEFESEFQDEVTLPDPALARHLWERVPAWARAGRLCRGIDVSRPLTPETFAELDMESRWEVCLRARFSGVWSGTPVRLERFPQAR